MQYRVTIPDNCKPGQALRIHCPDGTEANVKIPRGLNPGDSFIFELESDGVIDPRALLDSIKVTDGGTARMDAATTAGTTGTGADGPPTTTNGRPLRPAASGNNKLATAQRMFLDREIVNCQDFFLAMSVGLIIGLAIVSGFFVGVLYVTQDYPPPELLTQDE